MLQLLATAATILLLTQAGINYERKGPVPRYWGFMLLGGLAITTTIWAARAGV